MSSTLVVERRGWRRGWAVAALVALAAGCGAKTGLLVELEDAGRDADEDADEDVVEDADVEADTEPDVDPDTCVPDPVTIDRRRAEVMFTIDRSSSMEWTLEGDEVGWPPRWNLLRDALNETLYDVDHLLEIGAKFFPRRDPIDLVESCGVEPGVELEPAPYNTGALLGFFDSTQPEGGTPTALGLAEAREFLIDTTRPGIAQFVVLATDGGPNCNEELTLPCTCTGTPDRCDPPNGDVFNCLDEDRTLDVIERTADDGIPVFVIGIDDPNRDDLADFLDEMAVAGGRPRTEPGERLFYSVQREGELEDALDAITGSIARCLFVVDPSYGLDPRLEVRLDGDAVPRDETRVDGWDWTNAGAGELTLFGPSCDRAVLPGSSVTAVLLCPADAG
jgi:hypothetical protein